MVYRKKMNKYVAWFTFANANEEHVLDVADCITRAVQSEGDGNKCITWVVPQQERNEYGLGFFAITSDFFWSEKVMTGIDPDSKLAKLIMIRGDKELAEQFMRIRDTWGWSSKADPTDYTPKQPQDTPTPPQDNLPF